MKKYIIIPLLLLLGGCTEYPPQNDITKVGEWNLESGYLRKYVVEDDTIYVLQGYKAGYPMSITIKK